MPKLAELKEYFAKVVTKQATEQRKFLDKLETNPVHAFVWAEGVMCATAQAQVARHYLTSIENWEAAVEAGALSEMQPQTEEAAVEFIHKSVTRQAIERNAYVRRSTSVTSNFMEAEECAYYAHLAANWEMLYA